MDNNSSPPGFNSRLFNFIMKSLAVRRLKSVPHHHSIEVPIEGPSTRPENLSFPHPTGETPRSSLDSDIPVEFKPGYERIRVDTSQKNSEKDDINNKVEDFIRQRKDMYNVSSSADIQIHSSVDTRQVLSEKRSP